MKTVALVSGGKDSCFSMMECVRMGHEIVAIANLKPEEQRDEMDSYMYQTVGHEAIAAIASCMQLPLYRKTIRGNAVRQSLEYARTDADEVESLFELLSAVKAAHPDVQAVASGAILSNYQRNRVENVCTRLGLTSLAYLWQRNQRELLKEMVDSHVHAILIKTAAIGLVPAKHLGKSIEQLYPYLCRLSNICGEGGEYESFTLDCPLFSRRIVL
eukprot:TRINITY_DN4991_c0_g1_i2.p2 TRINITY_DN4991_c0_g1~~TRINITY_DN4991_c0_g1_i2.p2  ORF type:complete len:215 (-),score=56.56 TRINITY_DN4991_c0_g1_i2:181-825(-)